MRRSEKPTRQVSDDQAGSTINNDCITPTPISRHTQCA
jgi:hypothetical protein